MGSMPSIASSQTWPVISAENGPTGCSSGVAMALIRALLLILVVLPVYSAHSAPIQLQVVDIYPPVGTPLGSGQPLYLRLVYQSEQPVRFQARPIGVEADMSNAAPVHPAGTGEALVWIALRQPGVTDGIMVRYYNRDWQLLGEMPVQVRGEWRSEPISGGVDSAWVRELGDREQLMLSEAIQHAQQDQGVSGSLLMMLMAWSVPGYFLLQWLVIARWRDRWRLPGMLPLGVSVPVLGWTLFALLSGSNLWPLVMLFMLPVLFLYLALLALARSLFSGRQPV